MVVAPLGLVAAGVVAVVRRDWRVLIGACGAASVLVLAVTLPFLLLSGDCSAAQRATLPAERCETY